MAVALTATATLASSAGAAALLQEAGSGWPQFHGDAARTGLATGTAAMADAPVVLGEPALLDGVVNSPVLADLDGDGAQDIIAVGNMDVPGTLMSVKAFRFVDGAFAEYWTHELPSTLIGGAPTEGFAHVAVDDFDDDGDKDVFVSANYTQNLASDSLLEVLDGATGALLAHNDTDVVIASDVPPAIGDVNGDGVKDMVLIHQVSLPAEGTALLGVKFTGASIAKTFDTLIPTTRVLLAPPALGELRSARAGLEIVIGDGAFTDGASALYLCTPTGSSAGCSETVATPTGVRGIAIGDLDGDGRPEIVANGRTGDSLMVVKGTAATLGAPGALVTKADAYLWNTPSLGDVDDDGKLDIVNVIYSEFDRSVDTFRDGNVTVRGFDGTSIIDKGTLVRFGWLGGSAESRGGGVLADVTGDGVPELLFGSEENVVRSVSVKNSTTAAPPSDMWLVFTTGAPGVIAVGDVTGDGLNELVVGTTENRVVVLSQATATAPGAPSSLAASGGNATVGLSWTAPTNDGGAAITGYKVYRGTTAGSLTFLANASGTTYNDTTAINGTTYYYTVSAENSVGEGAQSNEASATPTAPSGPGVTLDPTSVDFGDNNIGSTSAAETVTLTNSGTATLVVGTASIIGPEAPDFAKPADTCSGQSIAPSGSCSIDVTFTPSAAGPRGASLSIPSNASGSPHAVALSGTGAPAVTLNKASMSYANQDVGTTSASQTVTLTNTGQEPLSIASATKSGTNTADFALTADTCTGASVAVNGTCQVSVAFTPTAVGGRSASLVFSSNAPGSPHSVTLSGAGVGVAGLTTNPTSLTFSTTTVGSTSGTQSVTISNAGTATFSTGSISVGGVNPADFVIASDACSVRYINPGASCTLTVGFRPSASGARAANLVIPTSISATPHTVSMSGTGVVGSPQIVVNPTGLTYADQWQGATSNSKIVGVTNTGTGTLLVSGVTFGAANPDFTKVSDGCTGIGLAAGASCQIAIAFAPRAPGARSDVLTIASNAGARTLTLSGKALTDEAPAVSKFTTGANAVLVGGNGTVNGTTTDDVSGVASAVATFTHPLAGTTTVNVALSCDASRRSCGWSITTPILPGTYTLNVRATDFAGRLETPGPSVSIIVA